MIRRALTYLLPVFCLMQGCSTEFTGDNSEDHLFMKFYGGAGEDTGNALLKLDDGFAVIGTTESFGNGDSDIFLVITDENGNAVAQKAFGGIGNQTGNGAVRVNDRLFIVGQTEDTVGNSDIFLLETSLLGDSLRSWTFGSSEIDEVGIDINKLSDGNLVISGTRYISGDTPDTYLIKLNAQLDVLWENKNALTDLADIFGKNLVESAGDQVVYCSTSKRSAQGNTDMRLTSINSLGEVAWNTYFGDSKTIEEAHAVVNHFGAYYVVGSSSSGGESDIWIVRAGNAGALSETFTIGAQGSSETGEQLVSLSDGNLLVVGERKSPGAKFNDIYLEKIDMEGNPLWDMPYILSGSLDDFAKDALEMPNGDLVVCGTVSFSGNPMMLLVKMNKDGKLIR